MFDCTWLIVGALLLSLVDVLILTRVCCQVYVETSGDRFCIAHSLISHLKFEFKSVFDCLSKVLMFLAFDMNYDTLLNLYSIYLQIIMDLLKLTFGRTL